MKPIFSLCHTTARTPDGWQDAAQAWFDRCDDPKRCEYILCMPENADWSIGRISPWKPRRVTISTRDGSVKGWNAAAAASTGQVIIGVADDWYPCEHWDTELLNVLYQAPALSPLECLSREAVIDVDTGGDPHLLTHCILTRKRYEKFGYLHHPDYLGVVADDEFTVQSFRDGVVVDARHLLFEHKHFSYGKAEKDSVYEIEQSAESWAVGREAFARHFGKGKPIFSLIHATARGPHGWEAAANSWLENAAHTAAIEYVLCSDEGEPISQLISPPNIYDFKHVYNHGRRCAVDAWNAAAGASTGRFIITVADDWTPPKNWDLELLKVIPNLEKEYVVWVATGAPSEAVMFFSLLTRPYYERYGYVFYPEYIGMCADNDFTEVALRDGVVIDCRKRLPVFPHAHPEYGTAPTDEIYKRQHRSEAWRTGEAVYNRRVASGFKPLKTAIDPWTDVPRQPAPRRRIVACLPGETFHRDWLNGVFSLQNLFGHLGFDFTALLGYDTHAHVTRIAISESVLKFYGGDPRTKFYGGDPRTPYVLWLDDDNVMPVETAQRWIEFMEANPQCDVLVGWCWLPRQEQWHASVGTFNEDGTVNYFTLADVFKGGTAIRPVQDLGSGFPCVLMRREALETVGARAFTPIPNEHAEYGYMGEDFSFFWRCKEKGLRCYFDPLGKIAHMKTLCQEPTMLLKADAPAEIQQIAERVNGKPVALPEIDASDYECDASDSLEAHMP